MARELEHEVAQRDIDIEQLLQKLRDKDSEIGDGHKQIAKYRERISMLLKLADQNNNLNQMKSSRLQDME